MDTARRPFQGVLNIIWFNWPFFAVAAVSWMVLGVAASRLRAPWDTLCLIALIVSAALTWISLLVSWYIYDASRLYEFRWLWAARITTDSRVLNINAGFDESSALLQKMFAPRELVVWDFFEKERHTEPSIRRARALYPPYPGTQMVHTMQLPDSGAFTQILLLFAAHEIRNDAERIQFFKSLKERLAPNGFIIVTEHLRDGPNGAAYHFGVRHFFPRSTWLHCFKEAGLTVTQQFHVNPFVVTFLLSHDLSS